VDEAQPVLQHLSLSLVKQRYRPADAADVERLVVLVEHQDGTVYHIIRLLSIMNWLILIKKHQPGKSRILYGLACLAVARAAA